MADILNNNDVCIIRITALLTRALCAAGPLTLGGALTCMIAGDLFTGHLAADQAGQLQQSGIGHADRRFAWLPFLSRVENLDPYPVPLRRHLVQKSMPEIGKDNEDSNRKGWEDYGRSGAAFGGHGEEKRMSDLRREWREL